MVWWLWSACVPVYSGHPPLHPAALIAPRPYQRVEVAGDEVAYVDTGGDGPSVLLVHGLGGHSGYWQRQVDVLANAGYRVVVPDLPGFGASDRPDASYTPPWFAGRLVGLLDALDIDQTHVVGHDMGGQIGLTLALDHPSRVRSLALAAPAGIETFGPGEAAWIEAQHSESRALASSEEEIRRDLAVSAFGRHDTHVETLIAERVRVGRHPDFAGTSVAISRSVAGLFDHPVRDRLPEVFVPVLIVIGRRDAVIPHPVIHGGRPAALGRAAHAELPDAELWIVAKAGHGVMLEMPEVFNTALLDFLRRHRGG